MRRITQGSYLNDVRITPDGRFVYIRRPARRVLDGDPSTQADKSVTVKVDGKPLQQPDGRRVKLSADGSR
jgi:hypothetical protein